MFELRFVTHGYSRDKDGEFDSHDFVIKNNEFIKEDYRKLFDKMGDLLVDYDFETPKVSKRLIKDWRPDALDNLIRSINWRSSLESFLLATVDRKEFRALLIDFVVSHPFVTTILKILMMTTATIFDP